VPLGGTTLVASAARRAMLCSFIAELVSDPRRICAGSRSVEMPSVPATHAGSRARSLLKLPTHLPIDQDLAVRRPGTAGAGWAIS